jgi:phage terminase large subunit-like protein
MPAQTPKQFVELCEKVLQEYINNILSGALVANRYEVLAVQRFLLLKEKYLWKEKEVKKFYRFLFLINIPTDKEVIRYQPQGHEIFWFANLLGLWKDESTKLFDLSYISIAKGNNKSTVAGILSIYFAIATGINNAHILLVARAREQSRTLIEYIDKMIKCSPAIAPYFKTNKNIIYNRTAKTVNRIEIKSSDAGGIHSVGKGLIFSCIDEFAVHKDAHLQQVVKSAQESKQKNHLQFIITHVSNDRAKSPAFAMQQTCQKILEGEVKLDNWFAQIFTQDSKEEILLGVDTWRKSNPSLGVCVPKENLISSYETSRLFTDKMDTFITFNMNCWTDYNVGQTVWLKDEVIFENFTGREIEERKTIFCGVDLSHQRDLTSIAYVNFNPIDETFTADVKYFFPNNERTKIKDSGSIDLSRWFITDEEPNNFILQSKMEVLDHNDIFEEFKTLQKKYNIDAVGFDPALAQQIEYQLTSKLDLEVINVRMNYTLTPAIQLLERLILTKKIHLPKNPVLRWNFQNIFANTDDKGNMYLKKIKRESIDGVVALTIALAAWIENNRSNNFYFLEQMQQLYAKKKNP